MKSADILEVALYTRLENHSLVRHHFEVNVDNTVTHVESIFDDSHNEYNLSDVELDALVDNLHKLKGYYR